MECMARSRLVVLVTGEGGIGYLYFDRGQVVHAITTDNVGEPAALEILGWTNGSFQPCDRPWPETRTIFTSHEALILQVAEAARREHRTWWRSRPAAPSSPRRCRRDETTARPRTTSRCWSSRRKEQPACEAQMSVTCRRRRRSRRPPARNDFTQRATSRSCCASARSGAILKNSGGSEELAEMMAYVRRLTDLAGELLGLDGFTALECTFTKGRCLAFVESNGDTVVLRPRPEANLQALRERLGL